MKYSKENIDKLVIEESLMDPASSQLVVQLFSDLMDRNNGVEHAALYFRDGTPFAQDPYRAGKSILPEKEQNDYYQDFGRICKPLMEAFSETEIEGVGRITPYSELTGEGCFVCLTTTGDPAEKITRRLGIVPLDGQFEYFVIGVSWIEENFNHRTFQNEIENYRDRIRAHFLQRQNS